MVILLSENNNAKFSISPRRPRNAIALFAAMLLLAVEFHSMYGYLLYMPLGISSFLLVVSIAESFSSGRRMTIENDVGNAVAPPQVADKNGRIPSKETGRKEAAAAICYERAVIAGDIPYYPVESIMDKNGILLPEELTGFLPSGKKRAKALNLLLLDDLDLVRVSGLRLSQLGIGPLLNLAMLTGYVKVMSCN